MSLLMRCTIQGYQSMRTATFRDYGDRYVVFEDGTVLGTSHDELLKGTVLKSNDLQYTLSKDGVGKKYLASRLVYEAFNGPFKGMIDFKDGNKMNVSLSNLVNVKTTKRFRQRNCHPVRCKKTGKEWESVSALSREIGVLYRTLAYGIVNKNSKYSKLYEKI